jgi:hypothetical protein
MRAFDRSVTGALLVGVECCASRSGPLLLHETAKPGRFVLIVQDAWARFDGRVLEES